MQKRSGVTRSVFLFGSYAIKVPRLFNGHTNFLLGCVANWKERTFCKDFWQLRAYYDLVAPSLWCSWFGLIQIQKRAEPIKSLHDIDFSSFKHFCTDLKAENFGFYNGRIVCLDYAE